MSMQTAFILAPQRFSCFSLNLPPSYPPLEPSSSLDEDYSPRCFLPHRSRRTTDQKLSALWSTTRAPLALPTRKNTRARRSAATRHSRKMPVDSSANAAVKWGQKRRETGHHDEATVLGTVYSVHYDKAACPVPNNSERNALPLLFIALP